MTTRAKTSAFLAQHGIEWDPDDDIHYSEMDKQSRSTILDAPTGKYFKSSGNHVIGIQAYGNPDLWQQIHEEVGEGLGDCSDGECESDEHNVHPALGPQFTE